MHNNKKIAGLFSLLALPLFTLLILTTGNAHAQYYLGGGLGHTSYHDDLVQQFPAGVIGQPTVIPDIQFPLPPGVVLRPSLPDSEFISYRPLPSFYPVGVSFPGSAFSHENDNTDTHWNLFVGYQWTPVVATELAYINLGTQRARTTFNLPAGLEPPVSFVPANHRHTLETEGVLLSGVFRYPTESSFSPFLSAGVFYSEQDYKTRVTSSNPDFVLNAPLEFKDSRSGASLQLGAGLEYSLSDRFFIRADYKFFHDVSGGDISTVGLSVRYVLGQ